MPESSNDNAMIERLDQIAALLRELISRQSMRPQRLLRLKAAADYLNVSPWRLRGLIARGELSTVRLHSDNGHAPFLLDVRDLDAFIEREKS